LLGSSLCSFLHSPVTLSLLGPPIFIFKFWDSKQEGTTVRCICKTCIYIHFMPIMWCYSCILVVSNSIVTLYIVYWYAEILTVLFTQRM
jgi:hypothetical protein